jgi:hypothetical protein
MSRVTITAQSIDRSIDRSIDCSLCQTFKEVVKTCTVSAPKLEGTCDAVSSTSGSISFRWGQANSAASVTYSLGNGTATPTTTAATSATINGLQAAQNYTFPLYAYTTNPSSTSNTLYCYGWTGEPFRMSCVVAVKMTPISEKVIGERWL